jgi:hypothetical protein
MMAASTKPSRANALTKAVVLAAVASACAPYSNYIGDELGRHRASPGEKPPTVSLIYRRLCELAQDGLLERSRFTTGFYGYKWEITPAGRDAIEKRAFEMTSQQKELARHALGLTRNRVSFRNHFVTGEGGPDHAIWMEMVAAGQATRRAGNELTGGDDLFRLTRVGAGAALNPRERLCPEDFPPQSKVAA